MADAEGEAGDRGPGVGRGVVDVAAAGRLEGRVDVAAEAVELAVDDGAQPVAAVYVAAGAIERVTDSLPSTAESSTGSTFTDALVEPAGIVTLVPSSE